MKNCYQEVSAREIDRSTMRYMSADCKYCAYRMRASSKTGSCEKCMVKKVK